MNERELAEIGAEITERFGPNAALMLATVEDEHGVMVDRHQVYVVIGEGTSERAALAAAIDANARLQLQ